MVKNCGLYLVNSKRERGQLNYKRGQITTGLTVGALNILNT